MSYSSAEINRISGSRLAVQGRKYIEQNGDVWIGTKENRLKRVYLKDTQIGVELYSDEPTVSLKTYLRTLTDNDTLTQEFMDSYKWAQKTGYKEFTYTGDNITGQTIYTSNSPTADILFTVTYTYTGDNLSQIYIEKEGSTFTLTKVFAYDINNNLTDITIT